MPIITFIDTQVPTWRRCRERNSQSEAIARNLKVIAGLTVPVVCTVIGEGGSGSALAIGVGDQVNMLRYSHLLPSSPRKVRLHPVEERREDLRWRMPWALPPSA